MGQIHIKESATIAAAVPVVYAILADYQKGHQAILPKRYFKSLTVLKGGRGAGTLVKLEMNVFGFKTVYHLMVSEPEPGRVLVETDKAAGLKTTFTLERAQDGRHTEVTIASIMKTSQGLMGSLEAKFNPFFIGRIYRQELQLLAQQAELLSESRSSGEALVDQRPSSTAQT